MTERCVKDNVQIYVGSSLLDWICEEQNSFNDWVKLGSNQFGVYFEGLVLYKKTVKIKFSHSYSFNKTLENKSPI